MTTYKNGEKRQNNKQKQNQNRKSVGGAMDRPQPTGIVRHHEEKIPIKSHNLV